MAKTGVTTWTAPVGRPLSMKFATVHLVNFLAVYMDAPIFHLEILVWPPSKEL